MSGFTRDGQERAALSGAALSALLDQNAIATPAYVYDLDAIEAEARAMVEALGDARHLVAYAVKANSAGSIIRRIKGAGCGAEVVSGAELSLVRRAGVSPNLRGKDPRVHAGHLELRARGAQKRLSRCA